MDNNYQVLARKWRPRNFSDMVGQEPILRMLANAFEQKRIHHAYLFTGTRGVGKTTIARIIAKCLNCETGITANPCGTCSICIAIDSGQFIDLYEVDAASRTKVEDTRELLENVFYPPTIGRYKVYLIDEVHMLSNHSFNALLKTLEEPPEHVKFLLATTDPKKLPITILSRCLQFHLKHITHDLIAKHLTYICNAEKITFDTNALEKLSRAANGSMRDALSLLDQAIAYGHGNVNADDVNTMLGSMAQDDILPLIQALAANDGNQVFGVIKQLAERGPDFQEILEEVTSCFHQIALAQFVPQATHIDPTFMQLADQFSPEDIQLFYQIALLAKRDLGLSANPLQGFEMAMLRMLAFKPGSNDARTMSAPTPITKAPKTTQKPVGDSPKKIIEASTTWRDMLPKLELSGMAYALAANCTLESITDEKVSLALAANHQPMLNSKLKERIGEALNRYLSKVVQLDINISAEELATPVKQQQQEDAARLASAKNAVLKDPKIKKFIDIYDATVDVSLLS